jgi:hypothetical protein
MMQLHSRCKWRVEKYVLLHLEDVNGVLDKSRCCQAAVRVGIWSSPPELLEYSSIEPFCGDFGMYLILMFMACNSVTGNSLLSEL